MTAYEYCLRFGHEIVTTERGTGEWVGWEGRTLDLPCVRCQHPITVGVMPTGQPWRFIREARGL